MDGVPQVRLPSENASVESYWATHPYNPASANYIAVGAIVSPSYRISLPSGQSLQSAIDSLPSTGGTIVLAPGGTYSGFNLFGRSNVHIICEDPTNRPAIVGQVRLAVAQEAAQLPTYDGYSAFDKGLKNNDPFFWNLLRNPTRNMYFKNVIFDGGNSVLNNAMHHVQDVLFDNVQMQNFRYPTTAEKHHRGTWNGNEGLDNVFFRSCQFVSSEQYIFYLDGAHCSGVVGSTIDASKFDGGALFLCNDDFSEDVDADGTIEWSEQRNAKYNVVALNTVYASGVEKALYDFTAVTGEHILVTQNNLSGISLNTLVNWDSRAASGKPSLIYDYTDMRVLNNTGGSYGLSYLSINHIGRGATIDSSYGLPLMGSYRVGQNSLAALLGGNPIADENPYLGTIYGPNYVWNNTIGTTLVLGNPPPGNVPPVVNAGVDRSIVRGQTLSLDATITDDGNPAGGTLAAMWTKVTGPGAVSFVDATAVDAQATFSLAGTYVLRLSATDGQLDSFDEVQVIVTNPSVATPIITPGTSNVAAPIDVSIGTSTPAATIRFTLDDSDPTANSPVYTGAFRVTGNTVVKAIAFAAGFDPSAIASVTLSFAAIASLLTNGNMDADANADNNPDNWQSRPGTARDTVIRRGGTGASLRKEYVSGQTNAIYVFQNINLTAGVTYALKGWIKTSADFAGSANLRYAITGGGAGTFNTTSVTTANSDWREATTTFIPTANVSGRVDLNYNVTAGTVWFEDVSLTATAALDATPPQATSFRLDDGTRQRSAIRSFTVRFSEDVASSISPDDLVVRNEVSGADLVSDALTLNYDASSRIAIWNLSGAGLGNGRYSVRLRDGGISDASGNAIAGTINGIGGATSVPFFRLLCDSTGDGKVTSADMALWQINYDPTGLHAATNTPEKGDWNLDGRINSADLALWQQAYGSTPPPIPTQTQSLTTVPISSMLRSGSAVL